MIRKQHFALIAVCFLAACASGPQVPAQTPATLFIADDEKGVQARIVDLMESNERMRAIKMELVSSSDHAIEFKTDCMNVADAFSCSMKMMAVGNSGWDGPYEHLVWRTLNMGDETKVSLKYSYCAINMMGKQNCNSVSNAATQNGMNDLLRAFREEYYPEASLEGGVVPSQEGAAEA